MRIAHVYKDSYPPVHGGIEQHIDLLAALQAEAGHDVEVIVAGGRGKTEVIDRAGFVVRRLPELARAASSPITFSYGHALRSTHADIAHFHHPNPVAELFSPLLRDGIRVAVSYHADITRQRLLGAAYRPVLRRFLSRADVLITGSERLRETSPALAAHRARCHVVPYGIAVPSSRAVPRAADGVLFVGRMREYKGLPVLLDAIARVPRLRLRLVGNGPERDRLVRLARALQITDRVEFLGEIDAAALDAELRCARALVLPSIRRSEAFGIVLVEALHRGTPLITTELGTATSWVNQDGVTGLVVPPGDPDRLGKALQRLITDDALWRMLSAGAARRAELFTAERMLEATMTAYMSA
ncbi:MAG: glycosyltransferase [Thermoleophilia bacterium]